MSGLSPIITVPPDLVGIPNIPPTAGITGARSGICSDADIARRTETVLHRMKTHEPINEFNRMWTTVTAQALIREGYLPSSEDPNIWAWHETAVRPLAQPLPDGRFIVDPKALGWSDIVRFNKALCGGQERDDGYKGFIARCLRFLKTIPAERKVLSYRKALECMLKGSR
jgi:hypothetical protein